MSRWAHARSGVLRLPVHRQRWPINGAHPQLTGRDTRRSTAARLGQAQRRRRHVTTQLNHPTGAITNNVPLTIGGKLNCTAATLHHDCGSLRLIDDDVQIQTG